ncbi:molybdenum-pterin-binding protein [bacterium]|nr:MAG: molybdenum-pterin-binding protein [bacterium]
MKLSARNQLAGKITSIEEGLITAKVKIKLGGGEILTSIISKESVVELGLKKGDEVLAVIKSTEVMIAKP